MITLDIPKKSFIRLLFEKVGGSITTRSYEASGAVSSHCFTSAWMNRWTAGFYWLQFKAKLASAQLR